MAGKGKLTNKDLSSTFDWGDYQPKNIAHAFRDNNSEPKNVTEPSSVREMEDAVLIIKPRDPIALMNPVKMV